MQQNIPVLRADRDSAGAKSPWTRNRVGRAGRWNVTFPSAHHLISSWAFIMQFSLRYKTSLGWKEWGLKLCRACVLKWEKWIWAPDCLPGSSESTAVSGGQASWEPWVPAPPCAPQLGGIPVSLPTAMLHAGLWHRPHSQARTENLSHPARQTHHQLLFFRVREKLGLSWWRTGKLTEQSLNKHEAKGIPRQQDRHYQSHQRKRTAHSQISDPWPFCNQNILAKQCSS